MRGEGDMAAREKTILLFGSKFAYGSGLELYLDPCPEGCACVLDSDPGGD